MNEGEGVLLLRHAVPVEAMVRSVVFNWKLRTFGSVGCRRQELRKPVEERIFSRFLWRSSAEDTSWYPWHQWVVGSMRPLQLYLYQSNGMHPLPLLLLKCVDAGLRGLSQVVLCNNPLSGLLILAALFVGDWWIALCALLGLVVSSLTGLALSRDTSAARDGLFGFNGVLCGGFFADSLARNALALIPVVISSLLASLVQIALSTAFRGRFPVLTVPFNVAALVLWTALRTGTRFVFTDPTSLGPYLQSEPLEFLLSIPRGIAQVFFLGNYISGLLILLAIAWYSRLAAAAAIFGAIVPIGWGLLLGGKDAELEAGLFSYNSVLTSIATVVFLLPSDVLLWFVASFMSVSFAAILHSSLDFSFAVDPQVTIAFNISALTLLFAVESTRTLLRVWNVSEPERHWRIWGKLRRSTMHRHHHELKY